VVVLSGDVHGCDTLLDGVRCELTSRGPSIRPLPLLFSFVISLDSNLLQVLLLHLLLDVLQGLTRVSPDLTRLILNVKLMILYPLLPLLVILMVEFTLNGN
jgi:hypothetical protein